MGDKWVPPGQEEAIGCVGCEKETVVVAFNLFGRIVHPYLPSGWLVTDSYPPGDTGLSFWCSVQCMVDNGDDQ